MMIGLFVFAHDFQSKLSNLKISQIGREQFWRLRLSNRTDVGSTEENLNFQISRS